MSEKIRKLGLLDVLAIGVNAIVGSGVFAMGDKMHRAMGGYSPLAYALCALLLTPVALCFAELAANNDATGGPYLYAQKAFGPAAGFIVGWSAWLNSFISWAAVTTLLIDLVGITQNPLVAKALVVGTILVLGFVNYLGVRPGAKVIQAVVVGKVVAIVCFIGVALFAAKPGSLGGALPTGLRGVGDGIYLALFPFQGFEVVPVPAGETKNPKRNVPLATLGALALATLLYVAVQALLELTYPLLGNETNTALLDAARNLGPRIGLIVFVGGLVSLGGFTAGSALGSPRYAQAMANDQRLPSVLARIHPRFQTPHVAIIVTTIAAALLAVLIGDYEQLVRISNVTIIFQYAFSCAAVLVLRRQQARADVSADADEKPPQRGFRVPFGPVLPTIGTVSSIAFLKGAKPADFIHSAYALAAGVPVALLSYWLAKRTAKPAT